MHALTVLPLPLFVQGTAFVWWISPLGATGTVDLRASKDFTAWIEARGYSLDAGIIGVEITPEDVVEWKLRWV
ncbi:hypothetical protein [Methylobacterium sp. Leaf85]|uniref:hypothetical protein n=1 Tax=Methylobacterium sp. Leaf85 TaxID=1736241 RepID=UPI0006F29E74|nr:hypothetical protein [Methylobacterium sp. Leaf85]KQO43063.1 hypothetical protein ASF08_10835 [Methylobacterium sp. Leaf85]